MLRYTLHPAPDLGKRLQKLSHTWPLPQVQNLSCAYLYWSETTNSSMWVQVDMTEQSLQLTQWLLGNVQRKGSESEDVGSDPPSVPQPEA